MYCMKTYWNREKQHLNASVEVVKRTDTVDGLCSRVASQVMQFRKKLEEEENFTVSADVLWHAKVATRNISCHHQDGHGKIGPMCWFLQCKMPYCSKTVCFPNACQSCCTNNTSQIEGIAEKIKKKHPHCDCISPEIRRVSKFYYCLSLVFESILILLNWWEWQSKTLFMILLGIFKFRGS